MTCRILIADDHGLFRDAMRVFLANQSPLQVVGEARDGREAIEQALRLDVDVVSMDILMPGLSGIAATQEIKRRKPHVRVLAVAEQGSPEQVREALRAGCDGFILKSASGDEFVQAIQRVRSGHVFIDPGVSAHIVELLTKSESDFKHTGWNDLTDKERCVVRLVAEGHTNRSVAEVLNKSIKTVEKYRASLMAKLGLRSATDLVVKALEQGWIEKEHVGIFRDSQMHDDAPAQRRVLVRSDVRH